MAIDTTSAMQDYLAALDALAYGKKEEKAPDTANEAVAVEQAVDEVETVVEEKKDAQPLANAAESNAPSIDSTPNEPQPSDVTPTTSNENETIVVEPLPAAISPEPEPEPDVVAPIEPKPEPAVNPAQAYRISPPPGYEDKVMAVPATETTKMKAVESAKDKVEPEKKKASRYVYTAKQISDDVVRLPAPTLKATITDPSESDEDQDMKAVENFFNRHSGPLYDARPGRKPGQLFQDRDETLSAILDKDKDISYDEAIEIRKLFEEVKEIHSPAEHTIFDDIGPIGEVKPKPYPPEPQSAQNGVVVGIQGEAVPEGVDAADDVAVGSDVADGIEDDEIFEDAIPGEEKISEKDTSLAQPVETKLTGCMPIMVSRFSSDEEGSVGKCVIASLDPTVVGYNILKLLRGTMIKILGVEIEGTINGNECLLSYTRKDDILKAAVEKKHGKGLLTEAAEERGEPSNLRVTDVTKHSKKVIREEIPVMPYETVGDLMPHDLVASFARVIFTNRGNDYMIVMSRTSPDLGVSWDRIDNDEPVKGLPLFSVILSAELASVAIRDFSRAGVVIAKKASPSSDLAYKYEAFEVTDNGNIIHAFPKQARNMAQDGRA